MAPDDLESLQIPESKSAAQLWADNYEILYGIWNHLGQPDYFAGAGDEWSVITEMEYDSITASGRAAYRSVFTIDLAGYPAFHHRHGALLLDWQIEMFRSKHPLQVVIGGFGAGKTLAKGMSMLYWASVLPGYRAFGLAPYTVQSGEVYKVLLSIIEGTVFAERFLIRSPSKPPQLIIGHEDVGMNSIEFFSLLDDPGKILTLTGDEALIDQAEQLPDLSDTMKKVESRFRGSVRGRNRRGQLALIANSAESPELWDLYDEASPDNTEIWAYQPNTFENTYLTIADLRRFERRIGNTEYNKRVFLFGERPYGTGEHFPRTTIEATHARWLDEEIARQVASGTKGWWAKRAPRVDVYSLRIPYDPKGRYVVVADPGWANPPDRNSSPISVWRIDGFPNNPAVLNAFEWVYGNGSPNPWLYQFREFVETYHAYGNCGFDATGFQAGYERLTDISELMPTPVNLANTNKYIYLNLTKKLMADGMYLSPNIPHLFTQMSKYRLPDEKIRQDLVMMLLVLTAMVEPMLYGKYGEEALHDPYIQISAGDRYAPAYDDDRYASEYMEDEY